ncbi:Crp/Fnr family transcriptional regulator [Bacillus sp. FJAT-45350]|uniref:Crp/Fnr family transcriptional regulator n=1 Tax=Bacillus sp. FJAT-45350 TaxID=2011014 RepID=UPI000BB85887|nr:Crp/Fnr family transcriptional regulator [Bacillus sp. FJAT-45350]
MTEASFTSITLFSNLSKDEKNSLDSINTVETIKKGEVIFFEFDIAEAIYFVNKGKIRISKSSTEGKEITLTVRKPGEIFAEAALFGTKGDTYPATATAIEESVVSSIQIKELEEYAKKCPEIANGLFKIMSNRLRTSQATLRDVALYGKQDSLASTLLRLVKEYGEETEQGITIQLKLTHEELGSYFGATRESVNRLINQLKREGIVSNKQGFITVHHVERLEKMLVL